MAIKYLGLGLLLISTTTLAVDIAKGSVSVAGSFNPSYNLAVSRSSNGNSGKGDYGAQTFQGNIGIYGYAAKNLALGLIINYNKKIDDLGTSDVNIVDDVPVIEYSSTTAINADYGIAIAYQYPVGETVSLRAEVAGLVGSGLETSQFFVVTDYSSYSGQIKLNASLFFNKFVSIDPYIRYKHTNFNFYDNTPVMRAFHESNVNAGLAFSIYFSR